MTIATSSRPTFIDPHRLYTLAGFQNDAGISATRMRLARQQGVDVPYYRVGRRKFVQGSDAIAYVKQLAQLGLDEE